MVGGRPTLSYQPFTTGKNNAVPVAQHPATWQPIRERAARLALMVEADLPAEVARAARAHGADRPLATVVAELLETEAPATPADAPL